MKGRIEEHPNDESLLSDPFDREYGLKDLLPQRDIADILSPMGDLLNLRVVTRSGETHSAMGCTQDETVDDRFSALFTARPPKIKSSGYWEDAGGLFPLFHERELIGYLLALFPDEKKFSQAYFKGTCEMVAAMLNQIIRLNCRVQMTSGLQCQVVEDSYAQLQAKAEQLARSEQKYRLLAESLEEEVEKKTGTIQKALLKMAQQEKMASVGQLAAGVAHEINNPMGFIISNLNTLKNYMADLKTFFEDYITLTTETDQAAFDLNRRALLDLFQKREISFIVSDTGALLKESIDGAERIKKIVMDLKEFSKPGVHDADWIDMNRLIEIILRVCRSHIGKNISIETDFQSLPQILCHPQEINQAIFNIILNAVQAMAGKGRIFISTRKAETQVEVTIRDTGHGIAQENLSKIFDPFFTTREVGSGTGLGLTFAYNVMQRHHGAIKVMSEIDKGSTFILCLPYAQSGSAPQ